MSLDYPDQSTASISHAQTVLEHVLRKALEDGLAAKASGDDRVSRACHAIFSAGVEHASALGIHFSDSRLEASGTPDEVAVATSEVLRLEDTYFRYWGKARPNEATGTDPYHLLVFHNLDVAAAARCLSELPGYSLGQLAQELGWPLDTVVRLHVFFMALHDVGKFARTFQGLAPGLSPDLVDVIRSKPYSERHDTLGWLIWRDYLGQDAALPDPSHELWADWMRVATGHHGRPPREMHASGLSNLEADDFFCGEDIDAARAFCAEMARICLPPALPTPTDHACDVFRRHSWRLAGMAVLADWLGSDSRSGAFQYQRAPRCLDNYWIETAIPVAHRVVAAAGLGAEPVRTWTDPLALFDYLQTPTPLQRLAVELPLADTPQLFLLEDVTGAGKTEAALLLAQRLMAAGLANGLYFGLPTMATANQMYGRVGQVYRRLYVPEAAPSLVLSHGARELVAGFRDSVLAAGSTAADRSYSKEDSSASAQCAAWLADSRKKALLAHVGVGTLDQSLMAILPVRHQSLRLLGLAGKVLLVDEVHAYDSYMLTLLCNLLAAHAAQGGNAILLSATLPHGARKKLVDAYRSGQGLAAATLSTDARYPLLTHAHQNVVAVPCDTRAELIRKVRVEWLLDEDNVLSLIKKHADQGRCVCWIRNTVGDARRAFAALSSEDSSSRVTLFHSRYAMGDRLDIENAVLARFGKTSDAATRTGQVLIATQVVEQSLDLDFDVLISDLAPIDLLIQRAGREHRHVRTADGAPALTEGREPPVLYVLAPADHDIPKEDWYANLFPSGRFVYPDVARLWLTQRVLREAGMIVSPGMPGEPGGVRTLVEAVYGEDAALPDSLLRLSDAQRGKVLAEASIALFTSLSMDEGYRESSSKHWYEESQVQTRLAEPSGTVFLCRATVGGIVPWRDASAFVWEQSSLTVPTRKLKGLSPAWTMRFEREIATLRSHYPRLAEPAIVLPLVLDGTGVWRAQGIDAKDELVDIEYDDVVGLVI